MEDAHPVVNQKQSKPANNGITVISGIIRDKAVDGIPKVLKSYYDSGETSSMTIKLTVTDKGVCTVATSYALKDEPVPVEIEVVNKGEDVNVLNFLDPHDPQPSGKRSSPQVEMFNLNA